MWCCKEMRLGWPDASTFEDRWRLSHELLDAIERSVAASLDSGWVQRSRAKSEADRRAPHDGSYAHFRMAVGPYSRDLIVTATASVILSPLNMPPDIAAPTIDSFFAAFVKPAMIGHDDTYESWEVDEHPGLVPYLRTRISAARTREILELPNRRTEPCTVEDGLGAISVEGGFESVIYFKGIPQLINWPDCGGSIGQYFVRTGQDNLEDELSTIRSTVRSRLRLDQPIATQVSPLLRLFEPGHYTLTNEDRTHIDGVLFGDPDELQGYYPDGIPVFLETRPPEGLDEATILRYQEDIARGARPLVVTASAGDGGYCEFVVDGHHKLRAYLRNQTPPNVLNIHRGGDGLTLEEGVRILERCRHLETYRRVKSKYGMR